MSASTAVSDAGPALRPGRTLLKGPGRRAGLAAVAALGVSADAPARAAPLPQVPENVVSRQVASVRAVWADGSSERIPEEVPRLISVRPGARYRPLVVRQSVKQLFALGRFRDVRVRSEATADGRLALRFELDPIPRIARLEVDGAPPGARGGLDRALDLPIGEPLPDLRAREEAAEEWLRSLGYLSAEVAIAATAEGRDLAVEAQVRPGPRAKIASFRADGVERALGEELGRVLRVSSGRAWSEVEVSARLPEVERRLRERGFLAGTARLDFDALGGAGVHLVLLVAPGPRTTLQVEGFGSSGQRARRRLRALRDRRLTPDTVEQAREQLLAELLAEGHRDARVEIHRLDSADGRQRTIRFSAAPGPRHLVAAASAEGAPPEAADAVASALAPFRAGRPFRESEWTAAAEGLRRVLRRRGFFEAEVDAEAKASPPEADPRTVDLVVRIRSGPAATIGGLRFEGREPFAVEELSAVSGLTAGSPYVAEEIVTARENLESFHRDRGFLEAVVEVEAPIHPVSREAEVRFRIRRGSYFTVGGIIIAGLEATRESLIRARLPFAEGDPLGNQDLLEVRRRLVSLGIFRTVAVDLLEPEEPVSERNVLIRVVEGPRTSIGYGAGYSEREQVRGEAEWTRHNLLGRGHTLSLFARLSLKGSRLVATYRGAESVAGNVPIFVSAFREAQDRESLDFIRTGVGVQFTRRVLGRDLFFRYDFTTSELFDVKIHPNQIDRSFADDLWLSKVSASMVSDSRDDPVEPRRGRFGIVDLEWSSAMLGSRAPFVKGLSQQYLFFPIAGPVVLAVAGRLGMARTIGAEEPVQVPITERFFAGGATTLRGFRLDRAGPLDESGYPLGGNLLIVGNLEVRFPIFGSLHGAVFSDHGGVYGEVGSFEAGFLDHNGGAGLRWSTPLGPVRFDYGIRIGDIGGASRGQWHFTIGHAF